MTSAQLNGKKLIVFVGGSSGLGYATIETLIASDESYHIVLGTRHKLDSPHQGPIDKLLHAHPKSTLEQLPCDFDSYASVKTFAETVLTKYATHPLDALVLCAGKIALKHVKTKDGEDSTLQVNVLSHALLIDLLDAKIGEKGSKTRVLIVASEDHRRVLPGTLNPGNIASIVTSGYEGLRVYQITKFLQIYLLFFAQERFADRPSVSVVAVCPGYVPTTDLKEEIETGFFQRVFRKQVMSQTFMATTIPDAGKIIAEGVTEDFQSGTYFRQFHRNDTVAEECYDPYLREQWKAWFIQKGVWHQETIEAAKAEDAREEAISRTNTEAEIAEWQPQPEPETKTEAPTATSTAAPPQPTETPKVDTPKADAPPAPAAPTTTAAPQAAAPAPSSVAPTAPAA